MVPEVIIRPARHSPVFISGSRFPKDGETREGEDVLEGARFTIEHGGADSGVNHTRTHPGRERCNPSGVGTLGSLIHYWRRNSGRRYCGARWTVVVLYASGCTGTGTGGRNGAVGGAG